MCSKPYKSEGKKHSTTTTVKQSKKILHGYNVSRLLLTSTDGPVVFVKKNSSRL